jgi:hypothetical protein
MASIAPTLAHAIGGLLLCGLAVTQPVDASAAGPDPCARVFSCGFEISNDAPVCWRQKLNDTGIQFCGADPSGNAACISSDPQGQDAHYGRDALAAAGQLSKIGGGNAGFDYTKISNNGQVLQAGAALGSGPGDWACTRDNVTGLVWEVKVDGASHFRHMGHRYTWYDPANANGNPGSVGGTSACSNTLGGQNCNTHSYAQAVNAQGLCGASDWRLPSRRELQGIVDYGRHSPAIDTAYFPNTATESSAVWADTLEVYNPNNAWSVYFRNGDTSASGRDYNLRVRLVRREQ